TFSFFGRYTGPPIADRNDNYSRIPLNPNLNRLGRRAILLRVCQKIAKYQLRRKVIANDRRDFPGKLNVYLTFRIHLLVPFDMLRDDPRERDRHRLVSDSVFDPRERENILDQASQPPAFPSYVGHGRCFIVLVELSSHLVHWPEVTID